MGILEVVTPGASYSCSPRMYLGNARTSTPPRVALRNKGKTKQLGNSLGSIV